VVSSALLTVKKACFEIRCFVDDLKVLHNVNFQIWNIAEFNGQATIVTQLQPV